MSKYTRRVGRFSRQVESRVSRPVDNTRDGKYIFNKGTPDFCLPHLFRRGTSTRLSTRNLIDSHSKIVPNIFYRQGERMFDAKGQTGAALSDLGKDLTFTLPTPAGVNKNCLCGRIGVKTVGVAGMLYSPVQEIKW